MDLQAARSTHARGRCWIAFRSGKRCVHSDDIHNFSRTQRERLKERERKNEREPKKTKQSQRRLLARLMQGGNVGLRSEVGKAKCLLTIDIIPSSHNHTHTHRKRGPKKQNKVIAGCWLFFESCSFSSHSRLPLPLFFLVLP